MSAVRRKAAATGALAVCSTSATACRGSSGGMPNNVRMTFAVAVPLGNLRVRMNPSHASEASTHACDPATTIAVLKMWTAQTSAVDIVHLL